MRMRYVLCVAAIAAIAAFAGTWAVGLQQNPYKAKARAIISALDANCLGCGPDAYLPGKTIEHAMAFALIASAGSNLSDEKTSRTAADWLVKNSRPGWGLGFAWDAFNDGSENPATTVYGITTALGARGLLDVFERYRDPRYLEAAVASLDYYSKFFTATENGGYFWYSDQASDEINAPNISAMMLAPLLKAGKLSDRPDFIRLAHMAAKEILASRKNQGTYQYWSYSDRNENPNDAAHAAFMVLGLTEYAAATGQNIDLTQAQSYLTTFIASDGVRAYSQVDKIDPKWRLQPARLWDIGMLAYTLDETGQHRSARTVIAALPNYEFEPLRYSNQPGGAAQQDSRMIAYILFALTRLAP